MKHGERFVSCMALGLLTVSVACSSSKPPATEPELTSLTAVGGHGSPYGMSDTGPWQPLTKTGGSKDYGYTETDPIKCGNGPAGERRYLNSLRGPQGQVIQYERAGSCCGFDTPNSEIGGMLDVFNVTWEGAKKPIQLYLNMYDSAELFVPLGMTARK
jgi:hypothetical protein